jgi:glycerol-3-phosphate dehydrogenase (NAD(P)+)
VLWARSPEVAEEIDRRGRNTRYLGDIPLTDGLRATDSQDQAAPGHELHGEGW